MRRFIAVLLGAALLVPIGSVGAHATRPERYKSVYFNAYWNTRRKIDHDTYLRTTWYSGAYDSGEGEFWSDLYKDTERCQKRDGADRCRQKSYWYGDINSVGDGGSFAIDGTLDAGNLVATYRLHTYDHGHRRLVGATTIAVDLVGTGDLQEYRESYTYTDGCNRFTYRGRYRTRDATATGTYAIGDAAARSFGESDFVYMSAGTSISHQHTC